MPVAAHMTVSQFERMAERLGPCELVRGEVVPLSPAGYFHNRIAMNVAFELETWARRTRRGRVVSNEFGVVTETDAGSVRAADVAYLSYKRMPRGAEPRGFARVPPELIVEVLGKGQSWKKVVEKAGEYLAMGVDRVWVVEPRTCRVFVFKPDEEPQVFGRESTIVDASVLPGFRCKAAKLFEA